MEPYKRVVAMIRGMIASGDLAVGEKLPSMRDLAEIHEVSLPTVHHAISVLREQGIVETRPRAGVVVADAEAARQEASLEELVDVLGADQASLKQELEGLKQRIVELERQLGTAQ